MAGPKTTRAVPVGRPEKGGAQRRVAVPGGAGKTATSIAKAAPMPVAAGKSKGKKVGQSALSAKSNYAGAIAVGGGSDTSSQGGAGAGSAVDLSLPMPTPTPVAGPRYSSEGDPGGIFDSIVNPTPPGGNASLPTLRTVTKPIVGPTSAPVVGSAKINSTVASTSQQAGGTLAVAAGAGPKSVAYKPAGTPPPGNASLPSAGGGPKSVASKPGAPAPAPAKPLTAQELAKIYG